jgi:hypothetical protein
MYTVTHQFVRENLQEQIPSSGARAERLLVACSLAHELEAMSRMLILRIHIVSKTPVDMSLC